MRVPDATKTALLSVGSMLFLLSASAPAHAQVAGPCNDIIKKYCSEVTPGGGRIKQCLDKHLDEASIACKDWIAGMKQKGDNMNRACFQEIAAFCNFEKPDQMSIVQCLNERYVNLRQECREKLREFMDPVLNP